jgi:hypothetical protein
MSTPQLPKPAKLFLSLISASQDFIAAALSKLSNKYGTLDFVSEVLPFDYTDYYYAELGQPLFRRFASFDRLISQDDLAQIKVQTNFLEDELSREGNRTVNIDPGYLLAERLVLASGKNYAHRIYLSQGIYAELTLIYQDKDYRTLAWTYPDYAEPKVRNWLRSLRQKYLHQLRSDDVITKNSKDE